MPFDREKFYEQQGLVGEPPAPARPAPLSEKDKKWLNLYRDNLPALEQVMPEAHGRIVANFKGNEQLAQPVVRRWEAKYGHLPPTTKDRALQEIVKNIQADPARYYHPDGSPNFDAMFATLARSPTRSPRRPARRAASSTTR